MSFWPASQRIPVLGIAAYLVMGANTLRCWLQLVINSLAQTLLLALGQHEAQARCCSC